MTTVAATHTIEGYLAAEVAPNAYVVENGQVVSKTSLSKWGGLGGLELFPYSGPGTVDVNPDQQALAEEASAVEARLAED